MRIYIILFIISFPFLTHGETYISPINITSHEITYSNIFSKRNAMHLKCKIIENKSNMNYYFWISRFPTENMDTTKIISSFFFRGLNINHTFTFGELISNYDNLIGGYLRPEIGYSFIKLLKPFEKFYVIMPSDKDEAEFYYRRFTFIPKSIVDKMISDIPFLLLFEPKILILEL